MVFDFFKVVLYFVGGVDYGVNALASSWWRRMLGSSINNLEMIMLLEQKV